MNNPRHKLVPLEPTEEQWSGFARKVVMWIQMQVQNRLTPKSLLKHLELTGIEPPAWLMEEGEMQTPDHAFSKGTIAAIIYRAMLEDAPASPTQPQSSLHELHRCTTNDIAKAEDMGYVKGDTEWVRASELQAALAAESELRGLEREVAETGALTLLHTNSYQRDDGWLRLDGPVGSLPHMKDEPDIRYLELRGLLERHPTDETLVRLREDG